MRIVWQGFTSATENKPYVDRLVEYLNGLGDDGTTYEFRGVDPPDRHLSRMTEWRCAIQAIASAIQAERDGVDAIVLGHFQDPGLWELRAALDIPVVGLGESSMLWACQLGSRFGLVTLNPVFERWHEDQVRQYALDSRFVGAIGLDAQLDTFNRIFAGDADAAADVERQFEERARELIARGAEVIIPAGGLPALLLGPRHGYTVDGATVLHANAVAAKQAEVAAKLHAATGVAAARRGTFAKATPEAVEEFLSMALKMNA